MNTLRQIGFVSLAAGLALGLWGMAGCRIERTRGQRTQARAIDAVLYAEAERLRRDAESNGPSEELAADYQRLIVLYDELLDSALQSGEGRPQPVQHAEDDLADLAAVARELPAFRAWDEHAQSNFEDQFWKARSRNWQIWRGPGYPHATAEGAPPVQYDR